mgnify:CR=1 FL=1
MSIALPFQSIAERRTRSINQPLLSRTELHKMQILALILFSTFVSVAADSRAHGKHGKSSGHAWVRDFDNLVAFGDRSEILVRVRRSTNTDRRIAIRTKVVWHTFKAIAGNRHHRERYSHRATQPREGVSPGLVGYRIIPALCFTIMAYPELSVTTK